MTNGRIKFLSGVTAAVFIAVFSVSAVFIMIRSEHECCGEYCTICLLTEQCEKIISSSGTAETTLTAAVSAVFFITAVLFFFTALSPAVTLISLKVELLA